MCVLGGGWEARGEGEGGDFRSNAECNEDWQVFFMGVDGNLNKLSLCGISRGAVFCYKMLESVKFSSFFEFFTIQMLYGLGDS